MHLECAVPTAGAALLSLGFAAERHQESPVWKVEPRRQAELETHLGDGIGWDLACQQPAAPARYLILYLGPHAGKIRWSKWETQRKSDSGGYRDRLGVRAEGQKGRGEGVGESAWGLIGIRPCEAIHPCILLPTCSSNQPTFVLTLV